MKYIFITITLTIFFNCNTTERKNTPISNEDSITADGLIKAYIDEQESPDTDPLAISKRIINENCVIFLFPTKEEMKASLSQYDPESIPEVVADMEWYPGMASGSLDSLGIKNFRTDADVLILKNDHGKEFVFKRKEMEGDMIMFNTDKEPVISSSIDYSKEKALEYFEKQ